MSNDKIIKIDSLNSRPHVRHRAVVNKVRKPIGDEVLNSEIAMTVCGRAIGWFVNAENLSLNFTNGETYARQCAGCFE